jgi:hypothetical protein
MVRHGLNVLRPMEGEKRTAITTCAAQSDGPRDPRPHCGLSQHERRKLDELEQGESATRQGLLAVREIFAEMSYLPVARVSVVACQFPSLRRNYEMRMSAEHDETCFGQTDNDTSESGNTSFWCREISGA